MGIAEAAMVSVRPFPCSSSPKRTGRLLIGCEVQDVVQEVHILSQEAQLIYVVGSCSFNFTYTS